MSLDAAADALRDQKPVTGEEIRALFDTTAARLEAENRYKEFWEEEATVVWSMNLREVVIDLLLDAGDPSVVNLFFGNYCDELGGLKGNGALVPSNYEDSVLVRLG